MGLLICIEIAIDAYLGEFNGFSGLNFVRAVVDVEGLILYAEVSKEFT